ncbi:MAG TPA: PIN domain-containing protein [Chloroflexota bacterium]|nr:PIN domain-containing protein [Chloroflexota bacterium]
MADQLGWLDTNLFIHALYTGDREFARSRALVDSLADGRGEGWLSPLVIHELTYVLSRRPEFPTRAAVHGYLASILHASGVQLEDSTTMRAAAARWATGTVSFVDAYLTELALRDELPVCSANRRDFLDVDNSYEGANP